MSHVPVLLHECINGLAIKNDGVYVDATYGGGGHSTAILEKLGDQGKLIAFDTDEAAHDRLIDDKRLTLVYENFRHLRRFLRLNDTDIVDGILADLGMSSFQLDSETRGFSARYKAPLDMRMSKRISKTAQDVLNTYSESKLQLVFQEYGEVRNAKTLARRITEQRSEREFEDTADLIERIEPVIKGNRNRYLAQVFQALRIDVNDELQALKDFLKDALQVLKPGGRLVVISFHSLEDRIVKHFMKTGSFTRDHAVDEFGRRQEYFKVITKKPIIPTQEEQKKNARARSAKLRIAEKR